MNDHLDHDTVSQATVAVGSLLVMTNDVVQAMGDKQQIELELEQLE